MPTNYNTTSTSAEEKKDAANDVEETAITLARKDPWCEYKEWQAYANALANCDKDNIHVVMTKSVCSIILCGLALGLNQYPGPSTIAYFLGADLCLTGTCRLMWCPPRGNSAAAAALLANKHPLAPSTPENTPSLTTMNRS